MDFLYLSAMEEHGLSYNELPEDAQTGIDSIKDVVRAFRLAEKRGQKPTAKAVKKLKAMDKWVYYEILDYLNDTDNNDDDIPFDKDDVLDDKEPKEENIDPAGLKIDEELTALSDAGITKINFSELRSKAPVTHKTIWDNYIMFTAFRRLGVGEFRFCYH